MTNFDPENEGSPVRVVNYNWGAEAPVMNSSAAPLRRATSASVACLPHLVLAAALALPSLPSRAEFDAAREYVETAAVAARYPDPAVVMGTPGLAPSRTDFTRQAEMMAFVEMVAAHSPDARLVILGKSQEDRAIPLLAFARPAGGRGAELLRNGKPTVLIIGQQHGNEPAGGEAALALAAELARPRAARSSSASTC